MIEIPGKQVNIILSGILGTGSFIILSFTLMLLDKKQILSVF